MGNWLFPLGVAFGLLGMSVLYHLYSSLLAGCFTSFVLDGAAALGGGLLGLHELLVAASHGRAKVRRVCKGNRLHAWDKGKICEGAKMTSINLLSNYKQKQMGWSRLLTPGLEDPAEFADPILKISKSYPDLKNEYFAKNSYHNRNSIFTADIPGEERKNLQRGPASCFQKMLWCDSWTAYFGTTSTLGDLTPFINGFILIICIMGLVVNGRTIFLLAYSIRRNSFTTFILNHSIADFAVLTSLTIVAIFVVVLTLHEKTNFPPFFLFLELFSFTYFASQFLLMAISLERCVAVVFPLWHHCHHHPYLPSLVCGLLWILSFLLSAVHFILHLTRSSESSPLLYQLIVNGLLCTPIMLVSTVTLWIHMRSKLQRNQRKLLTALLLALLCFLLLFLPMNVFYIVKYFGSCHPILLTVGMGCASLNSNINPLLYFLVGRRNRGKDQPRTSFKVALQRVFQEEQGSPPEQQTMKEDQL
ncbi:proto-oncogene Mas-like [Vipera latastei]